MFMIPWMQDLALQCGDLNEEHRTLLTKLNGLLIALSSRDRTNVAMACSVLMDEALAHFESEETRMREAGYPDFEAHREQHEALRRALSHLTFTANSGAGSLAPDDSFAVLERWFVPHLTHADKKVADFLAAKAETAKGVSG